MRRAFGRARGEDGSMRSKSVILHRAVCAVVILAAAVAFSGCSSVAPTDPWSEQTGRVTGTVRSDNDDLLQEIEVWLWVEPGEEGLELWYQTATDEYGAFEFDSVEMVTAESSETTYWIAANRTPGRSDAINTDYTSCRSAISVPRDEVCTSHMVLEADPGDPEAYMDD